MKRQKACPKCNIIYHLTAEFFYPDKKGKNGLSSECKGCRRIAAKKYREKTKKGSKERHKKWYKENRDHILEQSRDRNLRVNFGMTLDDYDQMFEKQDGVCAICNCPETMTYKGVATHLSVDHNHITGEIRGLLCRDCNLELGHYETWTVKHELKIKIYLADGQ
ncbi:unnamed protein product [marine sediment metagenome]|uniref:Recombination endonuclease VII n=1 Tax=marine sediment metagenome TaxID=412755 RepID=X0TP06_9ZZZZ